MIVYFCSSCGTTVPENSLKTGVAVRSDGDTIHCFKCVTSRVAKVSDSKVYRALLAKRAEGGFKQAVRRVSQRLITQVPDGRIKRVVKRVSQRLLGYTTGSHTAVSSNSRLRVPPGSASAVAAVAKRRTEAHNLAMACIACVVLGVGTLMLYIALGGKKGKTETASEPVKTQPAVVAEKPAAVNAPQKTVTPPPVQHVTENKQPVSVPAPAKKPAVVSQENVVIPPLLSEREKGNVSQADVRVQVAEERLNEAKQFRKEHPADLAGWQRKLSDITRSYGNTPAGEEAAQLLAKASSSQVTRKADSLDWFGSWQIENLEQRAKAAMFEEFVGEKFVLETYPPNTTDALRFSRTLTVPGDKPVLQFVASSAEKGSFNFAVEVNGVKFAPQSVRSSAWQEYVIDLSASKNSDVKVTVSHSGAESANAYWLMPRFVAKASKEAIALSTGTTPAAKPSATFANGINLLTMIDPLADSVAGTWRVQDGLLVSDNAQSARIEIPYQPPQEYDLKVQFARIDGSEAVCVILAKGGRTFGWTMGAWNNSIFGFETIAGVSAVANPTTIKRSNALENGREYMALISVRDGSLRAFLDEQLIAEWKTDFSDMDIYNEWKLRDPSLLGIGSARGQLAVKSIEIAEIKGKGKAMRSEQKLARSGDIKVEYERALLDLFSVAANKGSKAAVARAEQAKASAALAPMKAKLDLDAECFGFGQDLQAAVLAGASKLTDNRAFTLTKTDGRDMFVGGNSKNKIKGVTADALNVDQELGGALAQVKLPIDELNAATQYQLALLAIPQPEAAMKQAQTAMVRVGTGAGATETWFKDMRRQLESAKKDAALSTKAEHLLGHLAFLEREVQSQARYKKIAALCGAGKWRDAKPLIEEYRSEYMNSFALERVKPELDRWWTSIENETMSPLLKR